MDQKTIVMMPGEAWYGLCVWDGCQMPVTQASVYSRSLEPNPTANQSAPLFVSSRGRYLWCDAGFTVDIRDGVIHATSRQGLIDLQEGFGTLRGAYLAAAAAHFPPQGKLPPEGFFVKPQYNTWIELAYDQTQENVLAYARRILAEGYPAGIIMIDDGWNEAYGTWEFSTRAFPDPGAMVEALHQMGFEVMLWVCPFVSPDTRIGRELAEKGLLIRERSGEVAIKKWWNGYSAVLDLSHPEAAAWMRGRLDSLMARYGVDGFKFDAGDPYFYSADHDVTYAPITENGQAAAWARLGAQYAYNEFRACFASANLPLVQRLHDKCHEWGEPGMASLIPNQLCQGIQGYAFTCPDMVGGGMLGSFHGDGFQLDEELFVRYAQCAALSPMIQFSAAPWRLLSAEGNRLCLEAARLHTRWAETIIDLARYASQTGEPVYRYMEYEFPGQGLEQVTDQFMLGGRLLAAPVLEKGAVTRSVRLPLGRWRYVDGALYEGGATVTVPAPLDTLPYFILEE